MTRTIRNVFVAGFAALTLGSSLSAGSPAIAGSPFDGAWSVLIITDSGTCDRAYRYALRITNGKISYADSSFNVSGRVNPRGRTLVTVSAGSQRASGSGQLYDDHGQGQWIGRSANSACSGRWEAERRG